MQHGTVSRRMSIAMLCLTSILPAAGFAQAPDEQSVYTLERAIDRALASNPGLRAAGFGVDIETARRDLAALPAAMSIQAEAENFLGSGQAASFDRAETTLQLSRVLERGGKRDLREGLGNARIGLAETDRSLARLDLSAEVARRFIRLVTLQEESTIAAQAVAIAASTLDTVRRRVDVGSNSEAELATAEIALARAELGLSALAARIDSARLRLATLWGADEAGGLTVQARLFELPAPQSLESLTSRISDNPDLLRSIDERRILEAERRLSRARERADLGLSFGVRRLGEADDTALVSVGRWKGFGGETNFNGDGFECYTWAAGISALTKHSGIFSTSHVPTVHPCLAAKQGMTIDHISNGRFVLNIVCGWYTPEIEMFGPSLLEHDRRYDLAIEWIEIIKKLWTSEQEFDYEGEFFNVRKAICGPLPVQRPHPAVMSAGSSPIGRKFAAKYADVAFTSHQGRNFDELKEMIELYHKLAWDEHQRTFSVWTNAYIFMGETEKDAQALFEYVVNEKGDQVAAENLISILGLDKVSYADPEKFATLKRHFMAGWGGYPIIGTPEQVVDGLLWLSDAGFDGTLLSWPRYIDDMAVFRDEIYPMVVEAGLRG